MKKLYLINDICVCCGALVDEGTMVCQRCLESTDKEYNLWQEENEKKRNIAMKQKKKAYQKPEMAFIDMEKHTVTASPEMVSRISPKIDQIVQEIAYEKSAANPIKENALIDKEVPPAKYFAEDDTMRYIGKYPEYVGTMMICVDSFENGVAQGDYIPTI